MANTIKVTGYKINRAWYLKILQHILLPYISINYDATIFLFI